MPGTLAVPGYRPKRNGMYATPVVEGNTVVPTVIPPGSITHRARLGRSPCAPPPPAVRGPPPPRQPRAGRGRGAPGGVGNPRRSRRAEDPPAASRRASAGVTATPAPRLAA